MINNYMMQYDIDYIFDKLHPSTIPYEYINQAHVVLMNGDKVLLSGDELKEQILDGSLQENFPIYYVKLILDNTKLQFNIENLTNELLKG